MSDSSVIGNIISDLQNPEFAKEYGAELAKLSFSNTLFDSRSQSSLTQKELADRMKCSQSYIAQLESGEANPSLATIGHILSILKLQLVTSTSPLIPEIDKHKLTEDVFSTYPFITADMVEYSNPSYLEPFSVESEYVKTGGEYCGIIA